MASSVAGLTDMQMAIRVMKHAGPEVRKAMRREAAAWAPDLVAAIRRRARGDVESRIAATTKTTITTRGLRATIGTTGKLPSGEKISEVTRPYEFGTNRQTVKTRYRGTSPKGRRYQVDRRTKKQIPRSARQGRFIYQGLADATPDLVTRYVKAVVAVIDEAQ